MAFFWEEPGLGRWQEEVGRRGCHARNCQRGTRSGHCVTGQIDVRALDSDLLIKARRARLARLAPEGDVAVLLSLA